jgi:putative sporulation protein YyaC
MSGTGGCRVHVDEPGASAVLGEAMEELLLALGAWDRRLVFLCVGTDRSTGDALGPLVGERLRQGLVGEAEVLGTLQEPVHASNLHETLSRLRADGELPLVVAVDACLGRPESVGNITVGAGALAPGAGVCKSLPEVGDAFVTGTVNVGGCMEYFVLQNTRLYLVVRMAEVIARGLAFAARQVSLRRSALGLRARSVALA